VETLEKEKIDRVEEISMITTHRSVVVRVTYSEQKQMDPLMISSHELKQFF
jgi:hypothetical protein